MAHETLTPRLGIETVPLAVEAWSLRHWTTREIPSRWIYIYICFNFGV